MDNSAWVADEAGVLVFKPIVSLPSFETAQELLWYSENDEDCVKLSIKDDTQDPHKLSLGAFPSHSIDLAFRIKTEPVEETVVDRFTSPDTVTFGDEHRLSNSPSPAPASSTSLYQDVSLWDQLKSFAATSEDNSLYSDPGLTTGSSFMSDNIVYSDSDASPCPIRSRPNMTHSATKTSRYFSKTKVEKRSKFNITRPDWIKTLGSGNRTSGVSRQPQPENELSLEYLENLKPKPHQWTTNERLALLSLRRWYILTNTGLKALFNSLTGLRMRYGTLNTQFVGGGTPFNNIRCPFYSIPFDDPQNVYNNIRVHIESRAADLGIAIQRRRSPETHKYEDEGKQNPLWVSTCVESLSGSDIQLPQSPVQNHGDSTFLGGYTISDGDFNNINEFVDVELSPSLSFTTTTKSSPKLHTSEYHLAFRVWDDKSRTAFRDGYGFVADLFAHRKAPVPLPLPRDDVYGMFDVLSNAHMSCKGNTSSCHRFGSLILNYASSMDNPRLAVINLQHSDLNTANKKFAAGEIIKDLQSKGEMWWTRYKAAAEQIIWGDLPQSAILHTFHLSALEDLATKTTSVAALLNLDVFNGSSRTRTIAGHLRRKDIVLNTVTARAMGQVARIFGLGSEGVTTVHISDFVTCLTDGWTIQEGPRHDIHTMADLGNTFAIALGPRKSSLHHQDIIGAFMDGFMRGTQNLAYFSRHRRTT